MLYKQCLLVFLVLSVHTLFLHFLTAHPHQFVLQQAGFMTSVQGLFGKLGPKKGGGKKVSTARYM